MIEVDSRTDLRSLYLSIFETFSIGQDGIVEMPWPTNYTRKMIKILLDAGLVHEEEAEDETYYQSAVTYDTHTYEEAESLFDDWFTTHAISIEGNNTMSTTASSASNSRTEVGAPCLCGCGEKTGKANYRPGHDARHAGQIARGVIEDAKANPTTAQPNNPDHYAELPSAALREKAQKMVHNALQKASKAEPTWEEGIVKVGKTERVAQRLTSTGEVNYLDGDGNRKVASKTAAKTFQVG